MMFSLKQINFSHTDGYAGFTKIDVLYLRLSPFLIGQAIPQFLQASGLSIGKGTGTCSTIPCTTVVNLVAASSEN